MKVVDFDNQSICYILVFSADEEEWTGVHNGIFEISWSKRAEQKSKKKMNDGKMLFTSAGNVNIQSWRWVVVDCIFSLVTFLLAHVRWKMPNFSHTAQIDELVNRIGCWAAM